MRTRSGRSEHVTGEGLGSVQNPMFNNATLVNLFGIIPFSCNEFKNYRLVCRQWLKISLPRWRQNACLTIRDRRFHQEDLRLNILSCVNMISMPGDPFKLLGKYHFRKYNLKLARNMTFAEESLHGNQIFHFWNILGPLMTHITIVDSKIFFKAHIRSILLEMTPNLEFLAYQNNPIVEESVVPLPLTMNEWRGVTVPIWSDLCIPAASEIQNKLTHLEIRLKSDFPMTWVYYLARVPNIKVLKLEEFMDCYRTGSLYEELQLFFKSIICIREECNPECMKNIQHLNLLNASIRPLALFPASLIPILCELAFPLSTLALDIGHDQSEDGLKNILQLYPKTLEKLVMFKLGWGIYANPFETTFPFGVDLPLLTELQLIGPIFKNLHFLINTPNLKVLVILDGVNEIEPRVLHSYVDFSLPRLKDKHFTDRDCNPVHPVIASTDFQGVELKNLVLPNMVQFIVGQELCSGEQVEQLGKLMPYLKRVRLGLDNSGFRKVCQIWKQLEHLDIQPFNVSEEGFLGTVDGKMYSQPNLTDFKYLTFFRMGRHSQTPSEAGLSNNSVFYGLFATKCLKEVFYAVYPKGSSKAFSEVSSTIITLAVWQYSIPNL
ncbi:hypothetical protein Ocin01_18955 [Orchesella cincta]|uniref:F-box domain-containing protein n=1 Tax=Orchesella cincta TaxID=48709 RepID=A0A1D2M420_ORCCI|nr:hypothetical protein Ocin01_18955 [Orchesella cincta]